MALSKIPSAGFQDNVKFRNIIINGGMDIAQRGTSFSISDNIYTLDRYLTEFSGFGAFTLTQSTDAPDGFGYSLKLDCTTADASPASGDIFQLFHRIEGQNLQYLKKGTSSAESTTLSFWVKSNKTGNMQVNLRDGPNDRIIGGVYAINSANTWEKKTLTFAGDTSGTIDNDNTVGLTLEFPIGSGSNYSSGSVPTSWETKVDADRNAGSNINLADSTSNEWYITGIQLEAGEVASDFEFLPYDINEQRCHRYFQTIDDRGGSGPFQSSTAAVLNCSLTTELRAGASFSAPSNLTNAIDQWGTSSRTPTSIIQYNTNKKNIVMVATGMSGATAGHPAVLIKSGSKLDAEL